MLVSKIQLLACMPRIGERLEIFHEPLNIALERFKIASYQQLIHFLPNAAHESGCFRFMHELASGAAYDTRTDLGNTPEIDGDGEKYKGRGIFQCTGLTVYRELSEYFDEDFVNHPELLEQPEWACKSAGWFWQEFKQLGKVADSPDAQLRYYKQHPYKKFEWIVLRINGGQNGIESRRYYFELAKKALA